MFSQWSRGGPENIGLFCVHRFGGFIGASSDAAGRRRLIGRAGRAFEPGFEQAVQWVNVQDALLRSAGSGRWEDV